MKQEADSQGVDMMPMFDNVRDMMPMFDNVQDLGGYMEMDGAMLEAGEPEDATSVRELTSQICAVLCK